ncbi:hypothetical protein D3C72_2154070 [compost metagenome]
MGHRVAAHGMSIGRDQLHGIRIGSDIFSEMKKNRFAIYFLQGFQNHRCIGGTRAIVKSQNNFLRSHITRNGIIALRHIPLLHIIGELKAGLI